MTGFFDVSQLGDGRDVMSTEEDKPLGTLEGYRKDHVLISQLEYAFAGNFDSNSCIVIHKGCQGSWQVQVQPGVLKRDHRYRHGFCFRSFG